MRNWKGDILVGDVEELENLEASEIHARRPNAKDVITPKNGEHFIFPIGDVTVRYEELSVDTRGSSDKSQPKQKMTEKPATIFGRSKGITYCHHTEPRVQLYVPKEETFLIPLKCIVMTRTTHTNLDVFQESRIEDGLAFFSDPVRFCFNSRAYVGFFVTLSFFFPTVMFLPTDGETGPDGRVVEKGWETGKSVFWEFKHLSLDREFVFHFFFFSFH